MFKTLIFILLSLFASVLSSQAQTTGTGLQGSYYNNVDLSGTPVATRIDPVINFSWYEGSGPTPVPGVFNGGNVSIRWEGLLEAPVTGTYQLKTNNDDGSRLWIDNQLLIEDWPGGHAPEIRSATINLVAGRRYTIKLDARQGGAGAQAQFLWEYPGQGQQIVPKERLYPPGSSMTATLDLRNLTDYVGINTTNDGSPKGDGQQYWLAVKGRILAEEVQVQTGWADFVFAPDYKLPSLSSVESHIKQKGHLPGIPSAAEVEANGISVGNMNALLLQKIEELTLHVIKQQKEIAQLNRRVRSRKTR